MCSKVTGVCLNDLCSLWKMPVVQKKNVVICVFNEISELDLLPSLLVLNFCRNVRQNIPFRNWQCLLLFPGRFRWTCWQTWVTRSWRRSASTPTVTGTNSSRASRGCLEVNKVRKHTDPGERRSGCSLKWIISNLHWYKEAFKPITERSVYQRLCWLWDQTQFIRTEQTW